MNSFNEQPLPNYHLKNVDNFIAHFESLNLYYLKGYNSSDKLFETLHENGDMKPIAEAHILFRLDQTFKDLHLEANYRNLRKNYDEIRKESGLKMPEVEYPSIFAYLLIVIFIAFIILSIWVLFYKPELYLPGVTSFDTDWILALPAILTAIIGYSLAKLYRSIFKPRVEGARTLNEVYDLVIKENSLSYEKENFQTVKEFIVELAK